MTLVASSGFEGGTVGANIPFNSTDFFTAGSTPGASSVNYSDLHTHGNSSRSIVFSNDADSSVPTRLVAITAASTLAWRCYFYMTAYPPTNAVPFICLLGATQIADIKLSTTGIVTLRNVTTASKSFTTAWPLNSLIFFEWLISPSPTAGIQQARYQTGSNLDSATYNETITNAVATGTTATTADSIRSELSPAMVAWSFYLDDVGIGNTAYLGPATSGGSGAITVNPPAAQSQAIGPAVDTGDGRDMHPPASISHSSTGGQVVVLTGHPHIAVPGAHSISFAQAPFFVGNQKPDRSTIVELNINGTWVGISSLVRLDGQLTHTFGRATPFDPPTAGTMRIVVDNADGSFTTGNPSSQFYPYLTERIGIRVSYIAGSAQIFRFTGQVDAYDLDLSNPLAPRVVITASDTCARLARRRMRTLVEESVMTAAVGGTTVTPAAYLPMDDPDTTLSMRNLGVAQSLPITPYQPVPGRTRALVQPRAFSRTRYPTSVPTATIVPAKTGDGALAVGGSMSGIVGAGQVTVTRGTSFPYRAPVVVMPRNLAGYIEFWATTSDQGELGANNQPQGDLCLFSIVESAALNITGSGGLVLPQNLPLIALSYTAGPNRQIKVLSDPFFGTYTAAAVNTPVVNDGQPHFYQIVCTGGGKYGAATVTQVFVDTILAVSLTTSPWVTPTSKMILGGYGVPGSTGAQSGCANASYAFFAAFVNKPDIVPGWTYARAEAQTTAAGRVLELLNWIGLTPSQYVVDHDESVIGPQDALGHTALDLLQDLTATTGGVIYAQGDGSLRYMNADNLHPLPLSFTVDAGVDLSSASGLVWSSDVDTKPTAVTADCDGAAGSVTIASVIADTSLRQEETVHTAAGSVGQLATAASWRLNRAVDRRLQRIVIDLYTAANNLWPVLGSPQLGTRLRLSNLSTTLLGTSYEDYFIEGGSVTTGKDSSGLVDTYEVALDLSKADDPPRGVWGGYSGSKVFDDLTGGIGLWGQVGSTPPTLTWSTTQAFVGTHSLRLAWNGGGFAQGAQVICPFNLVIGNTYTVTIEVYAPTGSPDLQFSNAVLPGPSTSVKDAWTLLTRTFVATQANQPLQVLAAGTATGGTFAYVGLIDLVDGPTAAAAVRDRHEYGRWAANGLALAADLTFNATSCQVAGFGGGAMLTTNANDYPLDLVIGDERVTVTAVPSTATLTNLVSNPSFETNTAGWAAGGKLAAAITRDTAQHSSGTASGRVDWVVGAAGSQSMLFALTVTPGLHYSLRVDVLVPTGSPAVTATSGGYGDGQTTTVNDVFQTLYDLDVIAVTTTLNFGVVLAEAAGAGAKCYIDAVMVQAGSVVGPYADTTNTSGQTLTIVRGVAPTVAVAHTQGTPVDVWHPLTWAVSHTPRLLGF